MYEKSKADAAEDATEYFTPMAGDGETQTPWDVLTTLRIHRSTVPEIIDTLQRDGLIRVDQSDPNAASMMSVYGATVVMMVPLGRGEELNGVLMVGRTGADADFEPEEDVPGLATSELGEEVEARWKCAGVAVTKAGVPGHKA